MYIKNILIENVGPIDRLEIEFPFNENSKPKPLIIVGENGSGKSIVVSYMVNAILSAQQQLFDNSEVAPGKVYKYRSPNYIKVGSTYSFGKVDFEDNLTCFEWQLHQSRKEIEDKYGIVSVHKEWDQIPESESNFFLKILTNEYKF